MATRFWAQVNVDLCIPIQNVARVEMWNLRASFWSSGTDARRTHNTCDVGEQIRFASCDNKEYYIVTRPKQGLRIPEQEDQCSKQVCQSKMLSDPS